MRLLIWSCVLALAVFCLGPQADAGVDAAAIVKQHLDSRGGVDRILGLQGYQLRGTISQGGRTLPLHIWWKEPNKLRMDLGNGATSTVNAYDGKTAWSVEPGPWGRQASGMMPGVREMFIHQADWVGPFVDAKTRGIHLTPDPSVWGDGGYLFKVERPSGETEEVLLNSSMRLVAKEVFDVGPPGFEHHVERRYSNFRRIEGFAFPHRIEQFVDSGSRDATIEIDEAIIGPTIPDSLFVMPHVKYPASEDLHLVDMDDLSPLRDHFQADGGRVRLIAILSPTSSTSRQELLELRAVLDSIQDDRIAAYIIWTPILESDTRAAAAARRTEANDPRITSLWDPHLVAAQSFRDALQLKTNALNLCCFYGPEARWEATPMAPDSWVHPGIAGHSDSDLLGRVQSLDKIREMLAKIPQDKKKRGAKTSQDE